MYFKHIRKFRWCMGTIGFPWDETESFGEWAPMDSVVCDDSLSKDKVCKVLCDVIRMMESSGVWTLERFQVLVILLCNF